MMKHHGHFVFHFLSVYDEFLQQCQVAIKPETSLPTEPQVDNEDVYYISVVELFVGLSN